MHVIVIATVMIVDLLYVSTADLISVLTACHEIVPFFLLGWLSGE